MTAEENAMREYPDYPDEWADPEHPQAEFWKTDPAYWQAHLDYSYDGYRQVEAERYAWLREWEAKPWPRGDCMNNVEYLKLRVSGECHMTGVLAARLHLYELGCPEPMPGERRGRMSADTRSLCPACLAKAKGVPITDITVDELYEDEAEFAAYEENYIDKGFLVISYGAECRTCGYHVSYNHREPLPEENYER